MNILMVTHHYLHGNGGGIYASRAYINAFAEIADEITLLYPMKKGMEIEGISNKVKAVPIYNTKHRLCKALDLILGRMHRFFSCFDGFLKQGNYDCVVFDNSKVSYRLIDIAHSYGCKVITIHHNYEYEYNRDNISGISKLVTLFWVKRLEKEAIRKSDLNLTLTAQDRQLLSDAYNAGKTGNIKVLGCFEYKCTPPIKITKESSNYKFIITGNLSAQQTENSLIPWLDEYYKVLKETIPQAQLVIAGKSPSRKIKDRCNELGIFLYASPKNMQPLLDDADFYICPTALGGGLKLRVMDGLKNGLPVITHEVSARGYDVFQRMGYLFVYNDIISFKSCLKKLLEPKNHREDIQSLYNSTFTFNAGVERLRRLLIGGVN